MVYYGRPPLGGGEGNPLLTALRYCRECDTPGRTGFLCPLCGCGPDQSMRDQEAPASWFHVSASPLHGESDTVTLTPRQPEHTDVWDRSGCPDRVCVAPDVLGCLLGVQNFRGKTWHVYRTHRAPEVPHAPVWDGHVTGEGWFLSPVEFEFVLSFSVL